ncbi:DNA translocase%2C cell division protein [Streptococcus pneumoniae]|nr:DNA translocase%2C cell division protein [Streptococcus pneumoniae]
MANKNTSTTRRRPSKAELERKEAIQRMLISLGIAILLIFATFKLGAAGKQNWKEKKRFNEC